MRSRHKGGLLIAESPPLTLALSGVLAARVMRCGYVLNVSDLWPRSLVEMGVLKRPALIRAAEAIESRSYRSTKLITAQSPDIVANIRERFPACTVELLSNGVDTTRFHPGLRSASYRESVGIGPDDVLVTYAGLHGFAQGLNAVIVAADVVKEKKYIKIMLVGDGPAKAALMEQATQLGLDNVRFLSPIPREQVSVLLASSDIALVTLARPLLGAIPSKVYEAMASGAAVISATGGGADKFISESGAGLLATPGDAPEIAAQIMRLASDTDMRARSGAAGRQLACRQFDRALWADKLALLLEAAHA
jgi:glycosyltransferase involved in cell wall biosynthesis